MNKVRKRQIKRARKTGEGEKKGGEKERARRPLQLNGEDI
jgi:hypothetical protein